MRVVEHHSVGQPLVDMNELLLRQDSVDPIVQIITAVHHSFTPLGADTEEPPKPPVSANLERAVAHLLSKTSPAVRSHDI